MRYFVIAPDGQKYGPADVPTLNQWIREGRLNPQMMLEGEDGSRMVATSVAGLMFPGAPEPVVQPNPYAQPPGPAANPYQQPPTGNPYGAAPTANPYDGYYNRGSAYGNMAYDPSQFPKWNWGAFFFSWIWGLNHKKPITLLALVPYVGIVMSIYCGIIGYQWAWESGRFATPEECRKCQAVWGWWGAGLAAIGCVMGFLAGLVPFL